MPYDNYKYKQLMQEELNLRSRNNTMHAIPLPLPAPTVSPPREELMFYNRDGDKITVKEYGRLFADRDYRRIEMTEFPDCRVSTVWLGVVHGYHDDDALIFETKVFGGKHDGSVWRYATENSAVVGHWDVVDCLESGNFDNEPYAEKA